MHGIHPTATIDESAAVAEDVEIGPYCVVEADTAIGRGTVLRPHAVIRRYTRLGEGNFVDSGAVLGGLPQDLKFSPETVTYLRIGDGNVFRECVTISRGSHEGEATTVGSNTYWMAYSHAGHDAQIADNCVFINGACVAGHASIGQGAILSAHVVVHQFCWVGELVMSQGNAGTSNHIAPFTLFANINELAGLNSVGLRRAEYISDEDRRQIKEAFHVTFRSGLTPAQALEKMDACSDFGKPAQRFREFVRAAVYAEPPYKRPLCHLRSRQR